MLLDNLVGRLPAVGVAPKVVSDQGKAFEVKPTSITGYVEPTFTEKHWPEGASVLLIEAAGAVGKSSTASALAQRLRWPLVRAEQARVGSYSLSGLVQDALGFMSDYIQKIASGQAGVVVDSLDEAHFKVGTDNFFAFLENVASVAGSSVPRDGAGPSVVIFSRADTAEYIRLFFANEDLPLAELQIDFFDLPSAKRYIGSYLARRRDELKRPEYNVALAWPRPFETLRDERLAQIAKVMHGGGRGTLSARWQEIKDFLGYAPVLTVIAESLAVANPSAEKGELQSKDTTNLLEEIIVAILDREHKKFGEHLLAKLRAHTPADVPMDIHSQGLYALPEQQVRLISFTTANPMTVDLPSSLPAAVGVTYREAVNQFLKDHPFLHGNEFTSPVFADFIKAATANDPLAAAALEHSPSKSLKSVGPFFSGFTHSLGKALLSEDLIEHIVSSWNQESEVFGSTDYESTLEISDDRGHLRCARTEADGDHRDLIFHLTDLSPVLTLQSPLQHL